MPIPTPAIQQRKAITALTIMEAVMGVWRETIDDSPWGKQLRKVDRWLTECKKPFFKNTHLSAGARRDMDKVFVRLGKYLETNDLPAEKRAQRWSALWWTALTEITSARGICPLYCKSREWEWLEQTAATMAERYMCDLCPGCDVEGTQIALELP